MSGWGTLGDVLGGGINVPGASDRFQGDVASGKATIQNFGTDRAGIMSRIMGPTVQRMHESQMTARAGSDVSGIARDASGQAWLDQLRQQKNVLNPWISAASQLGNGAAGAMAGQAGNVSGWDVAQAQHAGNVSGALQQINSTPWRM